MDKIFLKTERLSFKYITQDDFEELRSILQDKDVMYAWEYDFTYKDVQDWIDRYVALYEKCNLGYFLIIENVSKNIIGQAALMPTIIENIQYYEIGYILKKEYWHNGYATEAAKALKEYAFNTLDLDEVIFEIRPNNISSRKVAEALGARICCEFIKNVRNKKMIHLIYKLSKN